MAPSVRSRNWVFTLNNPDLPSDDPSTWGSDSQKPKYGVWQLEVGEQGTHHIQGYLVFSTKKSLSQCRSLCDRAHWEIRRGTHAEAKAYCQKDDTRAIIDGVPVGGEFGSEPPGAGTRSDLVSVKAMLDSGASESAIADEYFGSWVRYHKSFREYRSLKLSNRNFVTYTTVYWGLPGTGKTRRAFEEAGPEAYWLPKPNGQRVFWDGYVGQENVVIDEFFGWMSRDLMCRICDRYPFRVETKGGSVPFVSRRIWITSNNSPVQWWPRVGLGPMRRRLQGDLGATYQMFEGGRLSERGCGLEAFPPQANRRIE